VGPDIVLKVGKIASRCLLAGAFVYDDLGQIERNSALADGARADLDS
jgi:hypothetical protein